jgi:hypothetical protein
VVLEANGQEQLIFKHAISTIVMGRTMSHGTHVVHPEAKAGVGTATAPGSTVASAASASGTEG